MVSSVLGISSAYVQTLKQRILATDVYAPLVLRVFTWPVKVAEISLKYLGYPTKPLKLAGATKLFAALGKVVYFRKINFLYRHTSESTNFKRLGRVSLN